MTAGNILIVEDESIIALDIRRTLTKAGYTVIGMADSSLEAIEKVQQLQPDLVLMDIHLEGDVDGIEAAENILHTHDVPIVYLTAHSDESTLNRAKKTAMAGFVLKPFNKQELTTMIEITIARHKADVVTRQALKEQQALNELKSRFVSIVSHEFRNPLNVISVAAELLKDYVEPEMYDKRQLCLEQILNSTEQMDCLLNNVLELAEAETSNLKFEPKPIDLGALCYQIVEEMQRSTKTQLSLNLKFERCQDLNSEWMPCLDEKLLRPVLINLLSNAMKYSLPDEAVDFECRCRSQSVLFQIRDRGIGIPPEDQPKLFTSFYRASNVCNIPGNGLGLSIVKQYVCAQGGTITFTSEVGKGTTFEVTIPCQNSSTLRT